MTKELEKEFAKVGDQHESDNPTVIAKFFLPAGSATWWATEYNPEYKIFSGYVTGLAFDEWGSFSLNEFEETVRIPISIREGNEVVETTIPVKVERDLHFTPKPIREALKEHGIDY